MDNTKKHINPVNLQIGRNIKKRRIELGLTQSEVGKLMEITSQQIQKYEAGINSLTMGKLIDVSKILSIPVAKLIRDSIGVMGHGFNESFLFEDKTEFIHKSKTSPIPEERLNENGQNESAEVISCIQNLLKLDRKQRLSIETLIKNLAEKNDDDEKKIKKFM